MLLELDDSLSETLLQLEIILHPNTHQQFENLCLGLEGDQGDYVIIFYK